MEQNLEATRALRIRVTYDGGSASDGLLNIYDASRSMYGLSRALAITTHAFVNGGEIRRRAESVHGARIFISPPRRGSFELWAQIVFDPATAARAETIILGAAGSGLYAFLSWAWSAAVNKKSTAPRSVERALADRVEPFILEMATALESPMADIHRPLENDNRIVIDLRRPRGESLVRLDYKTLEYVKTRKESEVIKDLRGNVTKYNILSGFGRFYDDELRRTVSFETADNVGHRKAGWLTWSLHQQGQGEVGKILIDVLRVLNARNEVKRYIVVNVQKDK